MKKNVVIVSAILLYILSTYFSYSFFGKSGLLSFRSPLTHYKLPTDEAGNVVIDKNAPKTEECPLNGKKLTKAHRALWEARRPLGVMVENSTDARPQSGITSADVVYEAVAEGGITRFLLVYYCEGADEYVGPVRSARVYYIDFLNEYGSYPLYAHVGGANCNHSTGSGCANGASADALGKIQKLGWGAYNDLNHVPFPVMWRDYERLPGRVTEHTVYSTPKKLWDYAKKQRDLTNKDKKGNSWDKDFDSWGFKDDEPIASASALQKINFDFWEGKNAYSVEWEYNHASNSFKRRNGGEPHLDKNNGQQIESKNVIVVFMDESTARDGYTAGQHLLYKTTGEGEVIVFLDGKAIEGKWRKKSASDRMRFFDPKGNEISLNRGQTFIEVLPKGNTVDY